MSEEIAWEFERKGWREIRKHFIWGFGDRDDSIYLKDIGLLEFELDVLNRVEKREIIVVPSELVGKGGEKYIIYSRLKDEAYEFVCGL